MSGTKRRRVLLVGNPNAGKTTLFNALTGARAKVGNYPGVTVERRVGRWSTAGGELELCDLPGTYSLSARSPEEQIAIDEVLGRVGDAPDAIVAVCDATALARSLYLAVQCAETGVPVVIALTMIDEAEAKGEAIDTAKLAAVLGVDVVSVVAAKGRGLDALASVVTEACASASKEGRARHALDALALGTLEPAFARVEDVVSSALHAPSPEARRALAAWLLLSCDEEDELEGIPDALRAAVREAREALSDVSIDVEIVGARYALVDEAVAASHVVERAAQERTLTERVDAALLHPFGGMLVFALVMLLVFESLFAWSEPLVGLVEAGVELVREAALAVLPESLFRELVVEGIVGGVGNVVVFVPQIALLFFFIVFLEGSGYLARVAFVIDRLMSSVGLSGKSFVPMLSGFACAVPAVLSTRTIENRRDRLLTMLALPFMSCSARLPIYVLVIATVFAPDAKVFGVLRVGTLVLLSMYVFSVVAAITAAALLRRTVLDGPRPTFVLELPPYRMPVLRDVLRAVWERVKDFLGEAGTMILALTIVMWALLSFPRHEAIEAGFDARAAQASAEHGEGESLEEALAEIDAERSQARMRGSIAGSVGRMVEPVLAPLGFDWRMGVGIIGAFAAREVFVSTLGVVFGIAEADEEDPSLRASLARATWPDGRKLMTPLAGVSLMVFFVLACQCMSTLAVVKRESGSYRWPLFMFTYMTVVAWIASFIVYQVGSLLGIGLS